MVYLEWLEDVPDFGDVNRIRRMIDPSFNRKQGLTALLILEVFM